MIALHPCDLLTSPDLVHELWIEMTAGAYEWPRRIPSSMIQLFACPCAGLLTQQDALEQQLEEFCLEPILRDASTSSSQVSAPSLQVENGIVTAPLPMTMLAVINSFDCSKP